MPLWVVHGFIKVFGVVLAIAGIYLVSNFLGLIRFLGIPMIIAGVLVFIYGLSYTYEDQAEFLDERPYLRSNRTQTCSTCGSEQLRGIQTCASCGSRLPQSLD